MKLPRTAAGHMGTGLLDVHELCYVHDIVNTVLVEDIASEAALERRLADTLRGLLSAPGWLDGWRVERAASGPWDLTASGPLPAGGKAQLCDEVKQHLVPSQFPSLLDRSCGSPRHPSTRVLAMVGVSPRLAALCREHGWSWFDLAGNCRLEIPGTLLIERAGHIRVRLKSAREVSLGSDEAGLVVRALLAPQHAGRRWTQRGVVAHFADLPMLMVQPSLSLVNKVVQHLRNEAFLEAFPAGGFRVRDPEGLLKAWNLDYRTSGYARRRWFTLLRGRELSERLRTFNAAHETPGCALLAGFSAAEILAPAVRQPLTWLMVGPFEESGLREALEAKVVDSGENVVALVPEHPGPFYWPDADNHPPCTNAVQTYVDLRHLGGRGEEAAEALLEQRLRPAWKAVAQ